jgi:hypothetical protein
MNTMQLRVGHMGYGHSSFIGHYVDGTLLLILARIQRHRHVAICLLLGVPGVRVPRTLGTAVGIPLASL